MAKIKDVCTAYGQTLVNLGQINQNLFALDADVSTASRTFFFKEVFPERFINVGIAEQNMVSIAAGLALMGYTPVATSLAKFITTRALDQIINCLAYPKINVNLVGFYAGLSIGKDGATHQAIEDIGVMRSIPNMTIVCPGSLEEIGALLEQSLEVQQPTYIRLSETMSLHKYPHSLCQFGKGMKLCTGDRLTIVTTGLMTGIVYQAISYLGIESDIDLIHLHTLKPVDEEILIQSAKKTHRVLTVEEHNVLGGLGSIVCDVLCGQMEVEVKKIGINDIFGRSGDLGELLNYHNLSKEKIIETLTDLLNVDKSRIKKLNLF